MGDAIFSIAVVVLAFINWRIYHRIFNVTYFGARGILRELVGCLIAAIIEVALVIGIVNNLFGTSFMIGS
ncbi:MAG: hypothetical protein LUG99_11835 [Lachnospiraceae bacterium]|nr:hypothetical protein [Lachnospiraceae bacterium]